jgi:transposase
VGRKCSWTTPGRQLPWRTPKSGEVRQAQMFVAVLGASNYTHAEATWTQNLWDWTHSHDLNLGLPCKSSPSTN